MLLLLGQSEILDPKSIIIQAGIVLGCQQGRRIVVYAIKRLML
jgi:hypothetical protein